MGLQPTCFDNAQNMKPINYPRPVLTQKLDREGSRKKVERLLQLRNELLREARALGDDEEANRLQNLGLFDGILPTRQLVPTGAWSNEQNTKTEKTGKDTDQTGSEKGEAKTLRPLPSPPLKGPTTHSDGSGSGIDTVASKPLSSLPSRDSLTLINGRPESDATETPLSLPTNSNDSDSFLALINNQNKDLDPFLALAYDSQSPASRARRVRRQHRRQNLRDSTAQSPASTFQCSSPPLPLKSHPGSPQCLQPQESLKSLKARIRSLSQSPILKQLISDLGLLADHKAGLYEPGEPEIERLNARVEMGMSSAVVAQLEGDLAALKVLGRSRW